MKGIAVCVSSNSLLWFLVIFEIDSPHPFLGYCCSCRQNSTRMAPPSSKTGATAANAKLDNPRASKKSSTLNTLFVVIVVVFVMVSFGMAAIGSPSSTANSPIIHNALADFKKMPSKVRKRKKKERDDDQHHSRLEKKATAKKDASALSEIGELICDDHGGPSKELAAEMIYWKDIPSDASWVSPFKKPNRRQFLTFEPDGGTQFVVQLHSRLEDPIFAPENPKTHFLFLCVSQLVSSFLSGGWNNIRMGKSNGVLLVLSLLASLHRY